MSKEITLPSGNTVKLKDPKTLLKKDRDKVLERGNGVDGVLLAVALQDGVIAEMITEWSFDLIPPKIKISSLGELTMADYDALLAATIDAYEMLFPKFAPAENPDTEDPKATTANSND